jgi:hypothetical protein
LNTHRSFATRFVYSSRVEKVFRPGYWSLMLRSDMYNISKLISVYKVIFGTCTKVLRVSQLFPSIREQSPANRSAYQPFLNATVKYCFLAVVTPINLFSLTLPMCICVTPRERPTIHPSFGHYASCAVMYWISSDIYVTECPACTASQM